VGYEDLNAVRLEAEINAQAEALRSILAARGLDVDHEIDTRIRNCRDSAQLATWLRKAAVADRLKEVF